jgi:nucleotide-binding universal stress UspA family protein
MVEIKNILVPTDCSELSQKALQYAISLAKTFKAKMTLLYVTDDISAMGIEAGYLPDQVIQKMFDEKKKSDEKQLEDFWSHNNKSDVKAELKILNGDTYSQIVKFAKKVNIDIIIMGTHGRTGFQHILMGSVAEKVVRYSPYPVLTVKSEGYQFKSADHAKIA